MLSLHAVLGALAFLGGMAVPAHHSPRVSPPFVRPSLLRPPLAPEAARSPLRAVAARRSERPICLQGDPKCPPPDVIVTPNAGTFTTASQTVTVDWCYHAPRAGYSILLNGVDVTSAFSFGLSAKVGCTSHATSTGTITLVPGTNTLDAETTDGLDQGGSDGGTYTYAPPQKFSVADRSSETVTAIASQTGNVEFTVTNLTAVSGVPTVTPHCGGNAVLTTECGTSTPPSIPGFSSATVVVSFRAANVGGTGTVTLDVAPPESPGATSSHASINVNVPPPRPTILVDRMYADNTGFGNGSRAYFTVRNTGNVTAQVRYVATCSGVGVNAARPCTVTSPYNSPPYTSAAHSTTPMSVDFYYSPTGGLGYVQLAVVDAATGEQYTFNFDSVYTAPPQISAAVDATGATNTGAGQPAQANFTIRNTGTGPVSFTYSTSCTGSGIAPTSACTVNAGAPDSLAVGASAAVSVAFAYANAGGGGNVTLIMRNPSFSSQYVSGTDSVYTAPPPPVIIVDRGTVDNTGPGNGSRAYFTVRNTGYVSVPVKYVATCSGAGIDAARPCKVTSPYDTPMTSSPGTSTPMSVDFAFAAAGGPGIVKLAVVNSSTNVQYTFQTDSAYTAPPAPKVAIAGTGFTNTGAGNPAQANFTLTNTGAVDAPILYARTCTGTGITAGSCAVNVAAPTSLPVGGAANVWVTFAYAPAGGGGRVTLALTNANSGAPYGSAFDSVYTAPPPPQVVVASTGTNTVTAGQLNASTTFRVSNPGPVNAPVTAVVTCPDAAVSGCHVVAPASFTVAANGFMNVTVTFNVAAGGGTGDITLTAYDVPGGTAYGSGTRQLTVAAPPPPPPQIAIVPLTDTLRLTTGQTGTTSFTVRNTGTVGATLALSATCPPPLFAASPCAPGTTPLTIPAGNDSSVAVTVQAGIAGTGSLTLTATSGSLTWSGTRPVKVTAPPSGGVAFDVLTFHGGTTIERGLCPTVAIVGDVAAQCGALRITHALPATTTYEKRYAPTLAYFSDQTVGPQLLVQVALRGTLVPDSVAVKAYGFDATGVRMPDPLKSMKYGGLTWTASDSLRFNTGTLWTDAGHATGIYTFEVEVQLKTAGVWSTVATAQRGKVAWVNRRGSSFGNGWWLLGLEALYQQHPDTMLWVGGDGSTRRYAKVLTRGDTAVYAAPALTRPDSLYRSSTSGWWRRALPHQVNVYFDDQGRHRQTRDTHQRDTKFEYDGTSRLSSILLPGGKLTTFQYATTGVTVTSPATPSARTTQLGFGPANTVSTITDPDGSFIGFTYYADRPDYAIWKRTDKRGTTTTLNWAASSAVVDSAWTPVDTSVVAHGIRTPRGRTLPTRTDQPDYVFNGPRPDADTTAIWVDTLGAPRRIIDAGSRITTVTRDVAFPALASIVVHPGGFEERSYYDTRGHPDSTVAIDPYENGQNSPTIYTWNQTWDQLTSITSAEGVKQSFEIDPATGNRISEENPAVPGTRVSYRYNTDRQLRAIEHPVIAGEPMDGINGTFVPREPGITPIFPPPMLAPEAPIDSIEYDPLGNVNRLISPKGFVTRFTNDSIGRTTDTFKQITPGDLDAMQQTTVEFDLLDRPRQETSFGPALGTQPAASLIVEHTRNAAGADSVVTRRSTPDAANVGIIRTEWRHDAIGRVIVEIASDGAQDKMLYDRAGNVKRRTTRTGAVIDYDYDVLDRLKERRFGSVRYDARSVGLANWSLANAELKPYPWFPTAGDGSLTVEGDVEKFEYDGVGNMSRADNGSALVRRAYYRNGALKAETSKVLTFTTRDSASHVYTTSYRYDRDGRLNALTLPWQLSPGAGASQLRDSIAYRYDAAGQLYTVREPLGSTFTFGYDVRGERVQLLMPGGVRDSSIYDDEGRIARSIVFNGMQGTAPYTASVLRDQSFTYDAGGRMLTRTDVGETAGSDANVYSGLGHLIRHEYHQSFTSNLGSAGNGQTIERFTLDALGNRSFSADTSTFSAPGQIRNQMRGQSYSYLDPTSLRTGRLRMIDYATHDDSLLYDAAGNEVMSYTFAVDISNFQDFRRIADHNERASFYGADGRLRAAESRQATQEWGVTSEVWPFTVVAEDYRYDALGRRVLVRTQRTCRAAFASNPALACTGGLLRRTIWSGDDVLGEIQMPVGPTFAASWMEVDTDKLDLPAFTTPSWNDPNPRYGRVAYTHAGGMDRPLAITRMGYVDHPFNAASVELPAFTIVPHWDPRGQADVGTMANGGTQSCHPTLTTRCAGVYWKTRPFAFVQNGGDPTIVPWHGTLKDDAMDGTGTLYRRNRTVSPETGRFTQEDPIGLAGGLNLYGFAGGDPVNFSDPLGLCPIPASDCPPGYWTALGTAAGAIIGGTGGGAGGFLAGFGIGAVPGGLAGAVQGAALGGATGAAIDGIVFANKKQGRAVQMASSLVDNITGHLGTVGQDPNADDANHHRGEIRGWINRVQKYAEDMKGKTQEAWMKKVAEWNKALEDLTPK